MTRVNKTLSAGRFRALALGLAVLILAAGGGGDTAAALEVGDVLPPFSGKDLDGKDVDSKQFANKALLIDFWSIYCSSCIQEMPHIVDLYNRYKDRGLAVVGVDLDVYGAKRVRKFLSKLDFTIPYPNILDKRMQIKALLGVSMLPTTVLADSGGVIRVFHVGYKPGYEKELEEEIKKYLPAEAME